MSSDDGNEYHKNHQQTQQSVTPIPPSNISSSTSTSSSNNSNTIRRKSLTQAHYQHHHQLQAQNININCNSGSLGKERDRDRIEICERSCNDVGTITNQIGNCGMGGGRDSNYGAPSASPIRFIQQDDSGYHTIGSGRLSACSSDRYEENITCCLPPPSPAPTSDRFVIGIPSPSNSHYQDHRFSVHQTRTMSPNSRFRTISSTDRYRDMSPKCDRFAAHYLANSTPLASTENYAYLNSIVHTPVKRYIPTPPPSNDAYSDSSSYHSSRSHPANNIPYRLRLKCCDQAPNSLPPQQAPNSMVHDPNMSDHYATPPRGRPIKCNSNSSITGCSQSGGSTGTQTISRSRCSAENSDYSNINRTPSVEYIGPSGGGRVVTPVSVLSEPNSISCLHCNTLRRATGVHQTTQTTGPISPVPISSGSNHDFVSSQTTNNAPPPLPPPIISPPSPIPSASVSLPSLQQQPPPPPSPVQSIQMAQSQESSPRPQRKETTINYTNNSNTRQNYELPPQSLPPPPPTINLQRPSTQQSTQHQIMIQSQSHSTQSQQLQGQQQQNRHPPLVRLSRKQKLKEYIRRQFTQFFGIDEQSEEYEKAEWLERQKRFAIRQFGQLSTPTETNVNSNINQNGERPDILPAQINDDHLRGRISNNDMEIIPKKLSVPKMVWNGCSYVVQTLSKKRARKPSQWSRSFAPHHITANDDGGDICDGLSPLQEDEVFFDSPNTPNRQSAQNTNGNGGSNPMIETRQMYMPERVHGWRTRSTELQMLSGQGQGYRGTRISSQLIDGVLDNSRRSIRHKIKLLRSNELDDRNDYRPVFTYWINTVQIMVLILSIVCYGFGPIGIGMEQRSSQVLVTSLSLQQVHHMEQRNVWIGIRGSDLVHLGAKFATCMRRDARTLDVITKTRRNERETACCIRNDDSGCVQSSQADCSVSIMHKNSKKNVFNDQKFIPKVRGLWPTKSISTWKKWSPGDSGPGGRISGSVCGLDPKYCDAPASIAPYEWPDDITKWPICRKTNSFSQRFRFKDHTAEHMVCEVIGHPCCIGINGDCRITTREYCDFVHGYFHEEASLCSQVYCLHDVCGMFPFISPDFPDQFYRLFTSLCLHAGVLHLAITVAFQHILLADLERLIGPIRTAIVYIGSGIAGNLTSAIFVPYKPEVGPLASLAGVVSSLFVLLILIHWKHLKKTHVSFIKLIVIGGSLFGLGTLPWQQNFTGLLGGIAFGITLTLALVPFVSITKYDRKSKINLIWTCMLLNLTVYTAMFIIFYVFPSAIPSLNIYNEQEGNGYTEIGGGNNLNDGIITCDNKGSCPNDAHIHA